MSPKVLVSVIVLALILLIANNSLYVISETERGVKLEFGRVVDADIPPGLHWKWPIVNVIRKFDGRILTVDTPPERFLTLEKKAVIVDSYAKWRIKNVDKFYTAANGEERRAAVLLSQRINEGLRNQFGGRTMHEVVSGERDLLMTDLTKSLNQVVEDELGVELIDIRVKRIDLPEEVSGSVYQRMVTEREREARDHRSRGKELAEGIRAAADREKVVIESEAFRDAEKIRGSGEAQAAATYAKAYNKNPEFYAFWRSLKAYEASFADGKDLMVLAPDNDFFKYMEKAK